MVRKNAVIVSFAIFFGNIVEKVKNKNVPRFNENMIKLMKSKNIVKKCLKKIWGVWGLYKWWCCGNDIKYLL